MEETYRAFGQNFSAAIIAKDFNAVHALMAPWLQNEPQRFQESIDERIREMCKVWNVGEEVYPTECELDGSSASTAESLREDEFIPNFPDEVTDQNFRYWMCMQMLPEEGSVEFDAFFDLWIAIVEHEGALRVGYYTFMDPD